MADVFFRASSDALENITYAFNFVHPITASMLFARETVTKLTDADPYIDNPGIQAVIDPTSTVHGVDYRSAFVNAAWEDQEENIAWILLNNLFAIHEGWAQRLFEETFSGFGYGKETFIKGLEKKGLISKFSSYFLTSGKTSSSFGTVFFDAYKKRSGLDFGKLDNYMLCYRFFKEARNCFMHGNFVASQRLLDAYNEYLPKATTAELDVEEVPVFFVPVLGQRVKISLRGVIGFSQIIRRIIIITDAYLSQAKAAEKEFLDRKPCGWTTKTINRNASKAKGQISQYAKKAGFIKAAWSADFQSFLITNHIFHV